MPNYVLAFPFLKALLSSISSVSDTRYGYIDKTGNYVIEPKFYGAESFSEGLALVYEKNKGEGFIDKTGEYVIWPIIHLNSVNFAK